MDVGPQPLHTWCTWDSHWQQKHVPELEFYRNRILVVVVQIDPVSEIIPSNVGFHINTYFSVKMHYYIYPYNLRTGDQNCKSIVKYKISKCIRLEQVIVVIDQALRVKATELTWKHSSIHANVIDTFHTIANLLASNWKLFQYVECILIYVGMRDIIMPTRNHCWEKNNRRIIWKNVQSISTILERWREYFQKLMDEENPRERTKWAASRSGGWYHRDHKYRDWKSYQKNEEWESYSGPAKLQVEVWTSLGRTGLHFLKPLTINKMIDEEKIPDIWR